jgi:hypothetical protein
VNVVTLMVVMIINITLTKIFLFVCLISINLSCDVERRIRDYSYTNEWYYDNDLRYQVYQTKQGQRYIIVLNKEQTKLKRKYLKR